MTNNPQTNLPPTNSAQANSSSNYATFLQRLMASITDSLILSLIPLVGAAFLFSAQDEIDFLYKLILIVTLALIPYIIFRVIYHTWFISQVGATPGKQIWGVVVTDDNDQTLSFKMAFFREVILKLVSSFCLGLGYLWMLGHEKKQTWHDLLAGTQVKSVDKSIAVSLAWLMLIAIVQALLIFYLIGRVPNLVEMVTSFISA